MLLPTKFEITGAVVSAGGGVGVGVGEGDGDGEPESGIEIWENKVEFCGFMARYKVDWPEVGIEVVS